MNFAEILRAIFYRMFFNVVLVFSCNIKLFITEIGSLSFLFFFFLSLFIYLFIYLLLKHEIPVVGTEGLRYGELSFAF